MRRISLPIVLIGVLVIALTLAGYFLLDIDQGSSLNIWALMFILLAEVVMFGGISYVRGDAGSGLFKTVGSVVIFILYGITAVTTTLVGRTLIDPEVGRPNGLILVQLGVIVIFAVVLIGVFSFSRKVEDTHEEDYSKIGDNTPKRGGF